VVAQPRVAERRRHQPAWQANYLMLQAGLGFFLWVLLAGPGQVREWFELVPEHPSVTDAFVFADLAIVALGSLLSGIAIRTDARWAVAGIAFTTGGVVYPTLYLVVWFAMEGTGGVALALMVWVSAVTTWICWSTYRAGR
jgi:hypothetical protein